MITADTSVVVAAFASWHECHDSARRALREVGRLPAYVLVETYSVLTRLPPPHRVEPSLVATYLGRQFDEAPLSLPPRAHRDLVRRAPELGVAGGAIYDALIAATARQAGATLLTRDSRAVKTYEKLAIDYRLLE